MKQAYQVGQTKPTAKADNATANTKCQCYQFEPGAKSVIYCEIYFVKHIFSFFIMMCCSDEAQITL